MAQYEQRSRTTERHEYVLPNPANHAEIGKALSGAYQDYKDATGRPGVPDDAVWITHADDEIIIYWEESK
jgi:hypothetical protein